MIEQTIDDMVMTISHKYFDDNDEREEFENDMNLFVVKIMQNWRKSFATEAVEIDEVRHG